MAYTYCTNCQKYRYPATPGVPCHHCELHRWQNITGENKAEADKIRNWWMGMMGERDILLKTVGEREAEIDRLESELNECDRWRKVHYRHAQEHRELWLEAAAEVTRLNELLAEVPEHDGLNWYEKWHKGAIESGKLVGERDELKAANAEMRAAMADFTDTLQEYWERQLAHVAKIDELERERDELAAGVLRRSEELARCKLGYVDVELSAADEL